MSLKILILGSSGFLGSATADYFAKSADIKLTLFDSVDNGLNLPDAEVIKGDIFDIKKYKEMVCNQDFIINFIGRSGVLEGFEKYQEYHQINNIALLNILDLIKDENKKPKIIFPSSRLVYSPSKENPVKEEFATDPISIYGINKLSCEKYLNAYSNMFDIEYVVLRISIPYGYTRVLHQGYGIVNNFISKSLNGESITIFGNGEQKRDILYITDLVKVLEKIIYKFEIVKNSTYNLGGTQVLSIYEIAESIINSFKNGKLVHKEWPSDYKKFETGDMYLNSSKLFHKIDYNPSYDFPFALEEIKRKLGFS